MQEKKGMPFFEDVLEMPKSLVVDELQKWAYDLPGSEPRTGKYIMGSPFEMQLILDFTGLRGSGSNVFWTFTHRVGKLRYAIAKADEWVEVNPNYTELYNQTLGQKQRIEGAIKSSLGSIAQSVADYELLRHDARRYREILDYFVKGKKDQHVMRSLFVDRVDAFTGEGYSLVTMAKRWPTIITDFIRMKDEWEDVSEIRKELDVSQAEATVLKTKNELYKEWKTLFLPTIKERYARIQALVKGRQRSIDEYKAWLKPYLAKYKSMKEASEGTKFTGSQFYATNAFATPGFGTMDAWSYVRIWVWRPFQPVEGGKPEAEIIGKGGKGEGFIIDPYDDHVKEWKGKIEKHYNVKISDKEVREKLKEWVTQSPHAYCSWMESESVYYILMDCHILLSTMKSPPPEGAEMDNLMVIPIRNWVMSQNNLLIHLLELYAREKWMEKYMDELIGARSVEKEIYEEVEREFEEKKPEKEPGGGFRESLKGARNRLEPLVRFFVKPGPYEPVFTERVSKMYMRASGFYFKQITDVFKTAMGIE